MGRLEMIFAPSPKEPTKETTAQTPVRRPAPRPKPLITDYASI